MSTRLQLGSLPNVAQVSNVPIVTTLNEADIREPDKKQASFAKAIQLYGYGELNDFFENIFEVNIATSYFNANVKTEAKYFSNEILEFSGYLQLLRITLTPSGNIVYDCNIVGELGNFFVDMGDALLSDLDMSHLDHDYTRENIINSWDTDVIINGSPESYAPGLGYYYPLVNRGTILGDESIWRVRDFLPCIYKYEYLTKIFETLGYTWESDFLETEFFKRQILYPNIDNLTLSQDQLEDRQFYVGRSTDLTWYDADGQSTSPTSGDINFNNESAPFFDPGGVFTTPYYTCNATGTYNFVGKVKLRITISHTNPLAVFSDSIRFGEFTQTVKIKSNNGSGWVDAAAQFNTALNTNNPDTGILIRNDDFKSYFETSTPLEIPYVLGTGDMSVGAGDQLAFWQLNRLVATRDLINPVRFYDAGMVLIASGAMHIKIEIVADTDTSFYGLVTNKELIEGDVLEMNTAIPTNIKQRDFVKSVMQEYFLQMQPDKVNPKKLIIETYVDYYDGDIVNLENKIDKNKEVVVNPMSELDAKTYLYKYKQDKDYYNKLYEANHNEVFGTHEQEIENDFIRGVKTNELIYSPTHNVANYTLGIAYPKIYDLDGSTVKRITPNVRNLYAQVKTTIANITFKETGGTDLIINKYGYAGHTDDPFNPTIDLNFGLPKEVYYSFLGSTFTNNNSYNRFHKPFIDQISHRDSKLVVAWLWLTSTDIENFSFRNKYFIDNAYYRVNKIIEYIGETSSTKCELLKLADIQVFEPSSIEMNEIPTFFSNRRIDEPLSTPSGNVTINTEYPVSVVGSNNIVIGRDARFISIVASEGISVADGVENISVVNTSNKEITESNTSYINGVKVSTTIPKKATLSIEEDVSLNLTLTTHENTFDNSWSISEFATGVYELLNTGSFTDYSKLHVSGQMVYSGSTNKLASITVVNSNGSTINGHIYLTRGDSNNLLLLCYDTSTNLVDLYTLLGTGKLCLPEIKMYP